MSDTIYPTLNTLINVQRTVLYSTNVQTDAAGREMRLSWQTLPRYEYRLKHSVLRQNVSGAGEEALQLQYMFRGVYGQLDSFLLVDPYSCSNLYFGIGNGSQTAFPLWDDSWNPVVGIPDGGIKSLTKGGVLQTPTTDYSVVNSTGVVTFVSAPANNAELRWTGSFLRRVRFASDSLPVTRIVDGVWEADVTLISVL